MSYLLALTLVLGPGVLAPADPLVLERVEVRRVRNGWGLDHFASPDTVRVAVDDCAHLGMHGQLILDDGATRPVYVVDCCAEPGCLEDNGLVADVNKRELGHRKATIVLWPDWTN